MAELADALDSGSSESNFMQVQVLFPAPEHDASIVLFSVAANLPVRYNPSEQSELEYEVRR